MKTKRRQTLHYCDIQIRKCGLRYLANGYVSTNWGMYYPCSSVIGLFMLEEECKITPDWENQIIQSLLHEINHWATFLLLDRHQWYVMDEGNKGLRYEDQLLERIANYSLRQNPVRIR